MASSIDKHKETQNVLSSRRNDRETPSGQQEPPSSDSLSVPGTFSRREDLSHSLQHY